MSALARIAAVAGNTLREAVRSRVLYTLLFFAVGIISLGVLLSTLSYVEQERILQDVGLAAIRLFGVAIAIFVGVGLLHREVDRRTIHTILSKPISRAEFLLGKYAGLVATLWLLVAIMAVAFVAVSLAVRAPLGAGHAAAIGLVALELSLLAAIATLFSSFTTPLLASLFSCGLFLAGHLSRDLRALGAQADQGWVRDVTAVLYRVLPDLQGFDLGIQAVHGLPIAASDVWLPLAYGVGYTGLLLLGAVAIFERRDFR
jgi:ABC-type transport system involved in multi-copper enzyme maturation permease subunit